MGNITHINVGPRVSGAVVHGNLVYVSGQVAIETDGAGVAAQTADILAQIETLLARAGSDKSRLLSVSVWLADIGTFAQMNTVWDAWVAGINPPARATVEARLAAPQYLVEIAAIAATA